MSKRARGKCGRFLALRSWLLESPAWRSLPSNARAIYIEIAARYYGTNNGRISYSVRQAAEALHISKPTACRMLKLLQERGFIVCTKRGAFSRKTVREASEWRLTACNTCTALGISVRAAAPVLAICRSLVAAGHDPHKQLRVYRGDVLCLTVRSIGEGAGLTVADDRPGRPKFRRHTAPQSDVAGHYDAKIDEARR